MAAILSGIQYINTTEKIANSHVTLTVIGAPTSTQPLPPAWMTQYPYQYQQVQFIDALHQN